MDEVAMPHPAMLLDLRLDLDINPTEEALMKEIEGAGWKASWERPAFGLPFRLTCSMKVDRYVTRSFTASGWSSWAAVADAAWRIFETSEFVVPK